MGAASHRLAALPGASAEAPAWSPDGSKVAFIGTNERDLSQWRRPLRDRRRNRRNHRGPPRDGDRPSPREPADLAARRKHLAGHDPVILTLSREGGVERKSTSPARVAHVERERGSRCLEWESSSQWQERSWRSRPSSRRHRPARRSRRSTSRRNAASSPVRSPSFCTITVSDLAAIPVGAKVMYWGPVLQDPNFLSSRVVLRAGHGNRAFGYCQTIVGPVPRDVRVLERDRDAQGLPRQRGRHLRLGGRLRLERDLRLQLTTDAAHARGRGEAPASRASLTDPRVTRWSRRAPRAGSRAGSLPARSSRRRTRSRRPARPR